MTVPRGMSATARKVSDMVREMIPRMRNRLSADELQLGIFLRGNEKLFESLKNIIEARIRGREWKPVPSDPMECKTVLDKNAELRWLLNRLAMVHQSPADATAEQGEQPE